MRIVWLGGIALVGAIAVMLLLTDASAADRVVSFRRFARNIEGQQVTHLRDAVTAMFVDMAPANAQMFVCKFRQLNWRCDGSESGESSADDFFLRKDANQRVRITAWDGSTAAWERLHTMENPAPAQRALMARFVSDMWPGVSLSLLVEFGCVRNGSDGIDCYANELQTLSPEAALTAIRDNPGSRVVGSVQ